MLNQVSYVTSQTVGSSVIAMPSRPPSSLRGSTSSGQPSAAAGRSHLATQGGQGLIRAQVAKAQLSALLDQVERGERIVITRRNRDIAELSPLQPQPQSGPRLLGQACDAGTTVPVTFFEPLPEDLQAAFEGRVPESDAVAQRSAARELHVSVDGALPG